MKSGCFSVEFKSEEAETYHGRAAGAEIMPTARQISARFLPDSPHLSFLCAWNVSRVSPTRKICVLDFLKVYPFIFKI